MTGRIESYLHSDKSTFNKGGVIVRVESQTDFAAKTDEFIDFAKLVAKRAYAAQAKTWDEIAEAFPDLEDHRVDLEKKLKERVTVSEIAILTL